jgi:F-type H+-transporting ATPase subunit b
VPGPTFIVELVIFLVVLGILAKYVLPPINRVMEARQETIERSISEAEQAKARARELEEQHRKLVEQGREEARALKEEAAKVGEQLREQLRKQGEEEYERLVARAGSDIEASARRAAEELRGQVAELVVAVVERVLDEGVPMASQSQLIDRAIGEVEAQAAAGGTASLGPSEARSVAARAGS